MPAFWSYLISYCPEGDISADVAALKAMLAAVLAWFLVVVAAVVVVRRMVDTTATGGGGGGGGGEGEGEGGPAGETFRASMRCHAVHYSWKGCTT